MSEAPPFPANFMPPPIPQRILDEIRANAAEASFRLAMRQLALGDAATAVSVLESALPDWKPRMKPEQAIVEYALARARNGVTAAHVEAAQACSARADEDVVRCSARADQPMSGASDHARAMNQRALIATVVGDYQRAELQFAHAIKVLGALWGDDHAEVGELTDNLATALYLSGRTAEAVAAATRARAIITAKGLKHELPG